MPEGKGPATGLILILDDDPDKRRRLESLLQGEGFDTEFAANEVAAKKLVKSKTFELLVVTPDFGRTGGGLDLCRQVKADPDRTWLPVLFITPAVGRKVISRIFEAGGDEFIVRPFRPEEVVVRSRLLVRKGRDARRLAERAHTLAEEIAERDDELDDLRRFAQDIVGSLGSVLAVFGPDLTVLFANTPFLNTVGADRREVVGRPAEEFFRAELLNGPLGRALQAALTEGHPSRLRRVSGLFAAVPNIVCAVTVTAIDYGGIRQALLIADDVTEQARAEAEIVRERSKLHDIVNALNAALCLMDGNLNILWKNRTFDLWFGDAFEQPGLKAFLRPLREDREWLEDVFVRGRVLNKTWTLFTPLGRRRHFFNIIAPIKDDDDGGTSQALILTQDVTEQETRVEQLQLLSRLSRSLQGTLDTERLHHVILLCVTAGHALGFNRAFLFTRNRVAGTLEGRMAVGPADREDAFRTWAQLSRDARSFSDLLRGLEESPSKESMPLYPLIRDLRWPLDDPREIVVRTVLEKRAQVVTDAETDARVTPEFRRLFGCREFVAVPMIAKDSVVGVILADNLYSGRPITDEHVRLLTLFATQAALAVENAETYAELQLRLRELRTAQNEIVHAEKLAAIGKMAAHVAHEIRNPLAVVGGFARALLKNPTDGKRVAKSAKIISEETARLEGLLRGVMDFSRPAEPVFQSGNLNETIETALETLREQLETANVSLRTDFDRSLPDFPYDEMQLRQVLHNLVRNAVEAMPDGGELTLATSRNGDFAALSVTDTGIGIPVEQLGGLFQPFFTTKEKGTGLGLAATKKIVDDHGGHLSVKSEPGQGAVFRIELPLKQDERRLLGPNATLSPDAASSDAD